MAYNTSYYDDQIKKYNQYADTVAGQQIADAQKNQQTALKNAYIQRVQNQNRLNQNLAMSGIRGGMTETANLNLANQYGQARQAANSDYANQVTQINRSADENKFNNMLNTESARRQYIENREAEDRANAREDKMIDYERRTANYTAKYSKYFSEDELKKALKKAKDPLEIQVINNRLGYVKAVKKGGKWL